MEGLIPLIRKAIMKSRSGRHYESLSNHNSVNDFHHSFAPPDSTSHFPGGAIGVDDDHEPGRRSSLGFPASSPPRTTTRSMSIGGGGGGSGKQLVRFRSLRMLSCVTE